MPKWAHWLNIVGIIVLILFALSYPAERFRQFTLDQAYNKGRAMERVCAQSLKDGVPLDCTHHNQNTGHTLNPSIKD